jgi:DNA-binding transcriptional LysR family regulator
LIVGPDHPFAREKAPIDPKRIADEILIVREQGSGSREVIAQALGARKIDPARTLEIGSTEAIKQVVAAGLGIAIVSAAAVKDQIALNRLRAIDMRGLRIERTLWKLKTPGRLDVPSATAFERLISHPAAQNGRNRKSA